MISRRHFILGTAAGLILPSYYDKVLAYFENHGEVYLDKPKSHDIEIFALDMEDGTYEFNLGDPHTEPPIMTVREYARRYYGSEEEYWNRFGEDFGGTYEDYEESTFESFDWDRRMSRYVSDDMWLRHDSSFAKAYDFLEPIDLGTSLQGSEAAGELMFHDGPLSMISGDYRGVRTADEWYDGSAATISLLQKRLNQLDMGVLITMAHL